MQVEEPIYNVSGSIGLGSWGGVLCIILRDMMDEAPIHNSSLGLWIVGKGAIHNSKGNYR